LVTVDGVEPTNNAAERALRPAVIWRRRSCGAQSVVGSRFAERLLPVVATLRQQEHDVVDYLTVACTAALLPAEPACLSAELILPPAA